MRHGTLVYTTYEELTPGAGEVSITARIPVVEDRISPGRMWAPTGLSIWEKDGAPINPGTLPNALVERIENEAWDEGAVFEDDREHPDE